MSPAVLHPAVRPSAQADLELSLPARPENVAVVRHVLSGVKEALGLGEELLADLKLAVSEACTNVVVHAYAADETGPLALELSTGPEHLEVVVRDQGRGMAPRADSPGLGVGLPLITSLASSVELVNRPGGGTDVRMRFATGDADARRGAG